MTRHISQAAERSPVPHTMRSAVRLLCSEDSSASGDTLVRKPAERDAAEQKPRTAEFFPANQENSQ